MGRFLHSFSRRLVLVFLLLALSGCAARYHEPPKSESQFASLEAVAPVWIVSIDGKKVSRVGFTGHKQFRVFPGDHVIEVQYSSLERRTNYFWNGRAYESEVRLQSNQNVPIKFSAREGRIYYLKAGRMDSSWKPFVTDTLEPVFSDPKLN
jgi:hypothetical protein